MRSSIHESVFGLIYAGAVVILSIGLIYSVSLSLLPHQSDIGMEHEITGYQILLDDWLGK
jgi:hypothetical protein